MRYGFIKSHTRQFPVEKMCEVMKVSRSGYYKWSNHRESMRTRRNRMLTEEIRTVYQDSKKRYGSPRIYRELASKQILASRALVARLMRKAGFKSIVRRKYNLTTDSSHAYAVAGNLLARQFTFSRANQGWVSDITYIATGQGWLYLTTVLDLFDRKVIGWALSETMHADQTSLPAFRMAVRRRPLSDKDTLIFHSDRGSQYACDDFVKELGQYAQISRSMSRKGNCWDNAVAESFFKTLKTELIYQNHYQTRHHAALSVFEYIETWYNRNRRHSHINNLTIREYEKLNQSKTKQAA